MEEEFEEEALEDKAGDMNHQDEKRLEDVLAFAEEEGKELAEEERTC